LHGKDALCLLFLSYLIFIASKAADTNPPPCLTVELRDGSRVVGTSGGEHFNFHSALLGITRGKKLVVLVGQRKAMALAVKNNRTENRFSGLLARLIA
jgi:hypothetical protein